MGNKEVIWMSISLVSKLAALFGISPKKVGQDGTLKSMIVLGSFVRSLKQSPTWNGLKAGPGPPCAYFTLCIQIGD
jgi:hypothetical protein